MLRREWKFKYLGAQLLEAAKKKYKLHQERLKWWTEQQNKVKETLKEKGIEIHSAIADQYSNKTQGFGAQVVVDPMIQRDLNECHGKIIAHADLVKQYTGWISVLSAHLDDKLELDHDDFLFFYGEIPTEEKH